MIGWLLIDYSGTGTSSSSRGLIRPTSRSAKCYQISVDCGWTLMEEISPPRGRRESESESEPGTETQLHIHFRPLQFLLWSKWFFPGSPFSGIQILHHLTLSFYSLCLVSSSRFFLSFRSCYIYLLLQPVLFCFSSKILFVMSRLLFLSFRHRIS